ncbi:hypothetical protein [Haloferula sargassicola]|uniref:Uncharacterized protein n=1 Tax=Haloferula sargassicola TaxID=490096 RepID=A0ABP9URE1_9BACT
MIKSLLFLVLASAVVRADMLPQLDHDPWTGWFAGYQDRKFRFGVNREGEAFLMPMKNRDETIYNKNWIRITPVIEQLREGRGPITKKVEMNGWTALTEASEEAEKIAYRGTVTGGAEFEVTMEIDGSTVRLGGRLVGKGTLTDEDLRFALRIKIPNLYSYERDEEKLEDKTRDDRYEFVRIGGKKEKWDGWTELRGEEISEEGFVSARIEIEPYDARLELTAGEGGKFELWTGKKQRLHRGLGVNWIHLPAKDPKGEARFELTFK